MSTDSKHTVHLKANSLHEAELRLEDALKVYQRITKELGTKPALWER